MKPSSSVTLLSLCAVFAVVISGVAVADDVFDDNVLRILFKDTNRIVVPFPDAPSDWTAFEKVEIGPFTTEDKQEERRPDGIEVARSGPADDLVEFVDDDVDFQCSDFFDSGSGFDCSALGQRDDDFIGPVDAVLEARRNFKEDRLDELQLAFCNDEGVDEQNCADRFESNAEDDEKFDQDSSEFNDFVVAQMDDETTLFTEYFNDEWGLGTDRFKDFFENDWKPEFFESFYEQWFEINFDDFEVVDRGELRVFAQIEVAPGTEVEIKEDFFIRFIGGGGITAEGSSERPIVFRGNGWRGMTFESDAAASSFSHCEIRGGVGRDRRGVIRLNDFEQFTMDHCEVRGHEGVRGGAFYIRSAGGGESHGVRIRNSRFLNNSDADRGGAFFLESASPFLQDNIFENNQDVLEGGAIFMRNASSPTLIRNRFVANQARRGGAVFVDGSSPQFQFSVFNNNEATDQGGALYLDGTASADINNTSLSFNLASQGGGIQLSGSASLTLTNSILHSNELSGGGSGPQLYSDSATQSAIRFTSLEGGESAFGGSPNITLQDTVDRTPSFAREPGEAGVGSPTDTLAQRADSPVIDAGDPGFSSGGTDIVGRAVPFNGFRVDMGAYEFPNNAPYVGSPDGSVVGDQTQELPSTDEDSEIEITPCSNAGDRDGDTLELVVESLPDNGGTLFVSNDGDAGREVRAGDVVDGNGLIYEPVNRRSSYVDTFSCRVRDIVLDADGEVIEERAMRSPNISEVSLEVFAENSAPTFESIPPGTVRINQELDYRIGVDDRDEEDTPTPEDGKDLLRVEAEDIPDWLTLEDDGEGEVRLTGTSPEDFEGEEVTVELRVRDAFGASSVQQFDLRILPPEPLSVDIDRAESTAPDESTRLQASGDDGESVRVEWRIFNEDDEEVASGRGKQFTFTPEEAGVHLAEARISDDEGSPTDTDEAEFPVAEGYGREDESNRDAPSDEQSDSIDEQENASASAVRVAAARIGSASAGDTPTQTREFALELAGLARLGLDDRQRGIVLESVVGTLGEADLSRDTTNYLLGALDNLILRNPLAEPLTLAQSERVTEGVSAQRERFDKLQLLKAFNILNALAGQQGGERPGGPEATLLQESAADLFASAARLDDQVNASGSRFLRLRTLKVPLESSGGSFEPLTLATGNASSAVTLSEQFRQRAAQQWGEDTVTLVLLDNRSASAELEDVTTLRVLNGSGHHRSIRDLGRSVRLALPVRDEEAATPKRFDASRAQWVSQGIRLDSGGAEDSPVRVRSDRGGDFALLSSSSPGSEAPVEKGPTDSVEELSSCLFDGL